MKKVTIKYLDEFFEDNLAKTIKNKHKLKKYYMNKMQYLSMAQERMNDVNYIIRNYNIFLIYEPKVRIVMSLNVVDKLVNHVFTKEVLIPACESRLDIRNVATRKNMGSSYGIKLLRKYIEYYKRNVGDNFYVLKLDISKYFYSIDHDVLKGMLRKILDDEDYIRVCNIIDSTNFEYINETIDKLEKKCTDKLPRYEKGKGLGIGNLSSQCLSVFYLSEIDHYIVHNLGLKHYVRYMDDFIILCDDKDRLYKALEIIKDKLFNEYKLKINKKKTFVKSAKEGFDFLGYRFLIKNNRTIQIIKSSSYSKFKTRIKKNTYLFINKQISISEYFNSLSNYSYSFNGSVMKTRWYIKRHLS